MFDNIMRFNFLLIAALFSISIQLTAASGHPLMDSTFQASFGAFFPKSNTEFSLDSSNGRIGTTIDFEDDLGFDEHSTLPFATFDWRITDRVRLNLEYFEIDRDSKTQIEKTINWGDLTFDTGAQVKAKWDVSVARIFLGYSFYKNTNIELGAGGGIHFMYFDAKLSGDVSVNGNTLHAEEKADGIAPLPNIGIYGKYAFTDKWLVSSRVDWFGAEIGDYDGDLWSVDAAIQYQAFENVGFGLNYRFLDLDIDADSSDWTGNANYQYHGPSVFMTVNF